jgi:hypothetical protein
MKTVHFMAFYELLKKILIKSEDELFLQFSLFVFEKCKWEEGSYDVALVKLHKIVRYMRDYLFEFDMSNRRETIIYLKGKIDRLDYEFDQSMYIDLEMKE